MLKAYATKEAFEKQVRAEAQEIRAKAERYHRIVETTAAYEEAVAQLRAVEQRTIGTKLGEALKKAKVADVVAKWGGTDGECVCKHCHADMY